MKITSNNKNHNLYKKSTKFRVSCDKQRCLNENGKHDFMKAASLRFANSKKVVTNRATMLSIHEIIVTVGYEAQTAAPSPQTTNKATTQVGVATRYHGNLAGHHPVAFRALYGAGDFCLVRPQSDDNDLWLGDRHLVGH